MRFILFILFIAMPFVELALLIKLGNVLGFWPTIAIVLFTALVGAYVLQAQGLATMQKVAQSMTSGEPPVKPVIDGFFLAISGAFLLTPGVITDGIGLLLLVPPVRHAIARWGLSRILKSGHIKVHTYTTGREAPSSDRTTQAGQQNPQSSQSAPNPYEQSEPRPNRRAPSKSRPSRGSGPVVDAEFEEIKKKK